MWDRRGLGRGGSIISIHMRDRERSYKKLLLIVPIYYICLSCVSLSVAYSYIHSPLPRFGLGVFKCCMYELTTLLILRIWLFFLELNFYR